MGQIINKVLFRYILLLLFTFLSSIVIVISIHFLFHHMDEDFQAEIANLEAKNDINGYILYDIQSLHVSFLALGAATDSKNFRDEIVRKIKNDLLSVEESINILNNGGTFSKKLSPSDTHMITLTYTNGRATLEKSATHATIEFQLIHLGKILEYLEELYTDRDIFLKNLDNRMPTLAKEIRSTNANLASVFEIITDEIKAIIDEENNYRHAQIAANDAKQTTYHIYELIIILLTSGAILFGIYRIVQQIIKLYQELENKLYTDALTKLDNRFALSRDIKKIQNPALIIVDINAFRTINELYGVDAGNEVLIDFTGTLKTFASTHHLQLYRIAGDEFVFLQEKSHHDVSLYVSLIEDFFNTVENKPILLKDLDDALFLDLSAGISFEKKNTLGTADIALNHAKELRKPFVFYHDSLESASEIAQGALWKKRIIEGIENNLFVPFFQAVVNREQTIVKYEALMRLEQKEESESSFISPFEFLEIASKTKHYDTVSRMTLLKSLAFCVEKNITVSLNLSYQDILNKSLHEELKKYILAHNIGKRVIFEIVESQHVKSYALLKSFMDTFKPYGVRFAIDDFGTGFSNFSHIFELSPHFIKIDGSLIKNIHIDKKSYELVKAIVFFSKELDIETIAEYVHCKEVFDIAYALGIDFFQGYYFGKPEISI